MTAKKKLTNLPTDLEFNPVKRKLSDLVEFENNPRTVTKERRQLLIDSLQKFNLAKPLTINTDGSVVAGNQRLSVLMELMPPETEIWCMVPSRELTKAEADEYNLVDNIEVGEWDKGILVERFDIDMLSSIGFHDFELADIGFSMDGFERPSFAAPKDEEEAKPNAQYFYIEYYGNEQRFNTLVEMLGDAMKTSHEVDPEAFAAMVAQYVANKAEQS